MEGVSFEESPIEDLHAGIQTDDLGKDRGSSRSFAIDASTERIIEAIRKVSLLLRTGKGIQLGSIIVSFKLLLPRVENRLKNRGEACQV